jgi:hypothetical protein
VEATEPQDVVVYDQSTRDASVLAADSFLSILLSKLDGCFHSVAILTGELWVPGRAAGIPSCPSSQYCLARVGLSQPQHLQGQWGILAPLEFLVSPLQNPVTCAHLCPQQVKGWTRGNPQGQLVVEREQGNDAVLIGKPLLPYQADYRLPSNSLLDPGAAWGGTNRRPSRAFCAPKAA